MRVDYRLSMVAAMDSATRDSGGSRRRRGLWAGFSLVRVNYAPAAKRLVAPCGFTPFAEGIAAIPASERATSKAARAFVDWMAEELG